MAYINSRENHSVKLGGGFEQIPLAEALNGSALQNEGNRAEFDADAELGEAIAAGRPVLIGADEDDVEALQQLAVTARSIAWATAHIHQFEGADVAVLVDAASRQQSAAIGRSLADVAAVRIVALPEMQAGQRLIGWLEEAGNLDALWALVETTPAMQRASELPDPPRKSRTRSKSGEDDEERKPTLADIIVRLARDAAEFFVSEDDTPFAAIEVKGHREVWPVNSSGFRRWLIHRFYDETGRAPGEDALKQARLTLEAIAAVEGEKHPVRIRTAEHNGCIYIDLCDDRWRAIEVSASGWRIVERPPVFLTRSKGAQALPEPARHGSIDDLRPLLNLAGEDDFRLIVAWLLAALRPSGPYPVLAIAGEPGTAKTSAATLLRSLLDPHVAGIRRPPKDERDLFIWASKSAALVYDNLSAVPEWLSDGLCVVATGGTYATRAMRTDAEEALFTVERPVAITSVGEIISRTDLADRAVVVTLEIIPESARMTKADFSAAIEIARPRIFGALLNGLSRGLRDVANVEFSRLPRMADFITWAQACETAYWDAGEIHNAFDRNMVDAVDGVLEGDAVAVALRAWFAKREYEAWSGRASALLSELNIWAEIEAKRGREWPKNPQTLSSRLTLAAPGLRKIGIAVQRSRVRQGREVGRVIEIVRI